MNNQDRAFLFLIIIGAMGFSFFMHEEIKLMNAENNPGYKFDKTQRAFAGNE